MKSFSALSAVAVSLAVFNVVSAVHLETKEFKRLIPADRLRDFPGQCFASTQCRVFKPDDTWSLAPFCGKAACRLIEKDKKQFLIEEVLDCGPLVDLEKTPGCELLPPAEDQTELPFPDCCPQYDCAEGTEVVYEVRGDPKSVN